MNDHQRKPEEVCGGLMVMLHVEQIQPLFPQHDDRTLRLLLQKHGEAIAAHMIIAGITAAVQLFSGKDQPA